MAVLLASLAALCFGTADFAGGVASRKNSVPAVLIWSQLAGLAIVTGFALVDRGVRAVTAVDLAWGAAAGVAGMVGLAFLYRGLARGYVSVVSPLTAVTGAAVPVIFGVATGEAISLTAGVGIGVSLPAIVLMSWNPDAGPVRADPRRMRASLSDALISGVGFGLFFITISRPAGAAGMWPLAAARLTSVTVMLAAATVRRTSRRVVADWPMVLAAGILDMSANIAFVVSLRVGVLAIVTVIASAYPAQTVLLSRLIHGERIGVVRGAGIALALVGIGLMSIP